MPHSVFCDPSHRLSRSSSPANWIRVHGAHPIDA